MIINIVIAAVAAATVAGFSCGKNTRHARILRITAQAITVATVAVLIGPVVSDSGTATFYLLGVPLAAAALPLLDFNVLLWVAAVIIIVWALLLGLGFGLYLLLPGFCMLAAAVAGQRASVRERQSLIAKCQGQYSGS